MGSFLPSPSASQTPLPKGEARTVEDAGPYNDAGGTM